jgi:hypothetical protein
MATLTPTLTLASSDMNGDVLNLSVSDSLTIRGQITTKQVAVTAASTKFAESDNYTTSWVYLKNLSSVPAELITIEKADGGDEYMELGIGEWAWFPWKSEVDLFADSAVGTPTLEVRIYQETAA